MLQLSLDDLITYQLFIGFEKACLSLPDGRQFVGQIKSGLISNPPPMTKGQTGVYVLLVGPAGYVYVGSTSCVYHRIRNHQWTLANNRHKNQNLQDLFDSYARSSITFAFFTVDDRDLAFEIEQVLVNLAAEKGKLLNLSMDVRHSSAGYEKSEETRQKWREAAKNRGEMPKETREKISQTLKGREVSDDRAKELAELSRSLRQDPEFVTRWRAKRCKPVEVDGVVYESLSDAAKVYGCTAGRVLARIKSPNEKFKGWKYAE